MTQTFRCPHCNAIVSAKKGTAPRDLLCSACGSRLYQPSRRRKSTVPWTTRQTDPNDIVLK